MSAGMSTWGTTPWLKNSSSNASRALDRELYSQPPRRYPTAAQASADPPPLDKIIIAIHGTGSRRRSDTIRLIQTNMISASAATDRKAHNDDWSDDEVFRHFIDDIVMRSSVPPAVLSAAVPVPQSSRMVGIVGTAIPYALTALVHLGVVFVLFKSVASFLTTSDSSNGVALSETSVQVTLLALLMPGITVVARLPRRARRRPGPELLPC